MHSDDSNRFADYLYQKLKRNKLDVFRYEEDVTFGHSECSIIYSQFRIWDKIASVVRLYKIANFAWFWLKDLKSSDYFTWYQRCCIASLYGRICCSETRVSNVRGVQVPMPSGGDQSRLHRRRILSLRIPEHGARRRGRRHPRSVRRHHVSRWRPTACRFVRWGLHCTTQQSSTLCGATQRPRLRERRRGNSSSQSWSVLRQSVLGDPRQTWRPPRRCWAWEKTITGVNVSVVMRSIVVARTC